MLTLPSPSVSIAATSLCVASDMPSVVGRTSIRFKEAAVVARRPLVFVALSVPSPIAAALSSSIASGRPRGRTPIEHPGIEGLGIEG